MASGTLRIQGMPPVSRAALSGRKLTASHAHQIMEAARFLNDNRAVRERFGRCFARNFDKQIFCDNILSFSPGLDPTAVRQLFPENIYARGMFFWVDSPIGGSFSYYSRDPEQRETYGILGIGRHGTAFSHEAAGYGDLLQYSISNLAGQVTDPVIPGALSVRKNWWSGSVGAKRSRSLWEVVMDPRRPEWSHFASVRDRERRDAGRVIGLVKDRIYEAGGNRSFSSDDVLSITVFGSTVHNMGRHPSLGDNDYLAVVKNSGLDLSEKQLKKEPTDKDGKVTDMIHIIGSSSFASDSRSRFFDFIELALYAEHGIVIYGEHPLPVPPPVIERAKSAYYFANVAQKNYFNSGKDGLRVEFRDCKKRLINCKLIIWWIKRTLSLEEQDLRESGALHVRDSKDLEGIRASFRRNLPGFEFDLRREWGEVDHVIDGQLTDSEIESRKTELLVEAATLKQQILSFICDITNLDDGNDLWEKVNPPA